MSIREKISEYFRSRSPFRITTDLIFYILILSLILPFSRKYVATGLNKLVMHRPAIIQEERQERLEPGDYDWILMDMKGRQVPFSRFQGQMVFLSFWATWCPPCRAEMPNIQRLYLEYGELMSFVMASNEDKEVLTRYLDQNDFHMPVYRMVQNPPEKLQVSTIPTTFLIGPDGRIRVRKTGAARWDGCFFRDYLSEILIK